MNTTKKNRPFSYKVKDFIKKGGHGFFTDEKMDEIFHNYYTYMKELNNTDYTITIKLYSAYNFCQYLHRHHKSLFDFSPEDIHKHVNGYYKYQWSFAYRELNTYYLRYFLNWAFESEFISVSGYSAIPKIVWHRDYRIKSFYTRKEVTKMLNQIDLRTKQGKEDYLILSIIYYWGLRISDVINLKLSDFDFNENSVCIVQKKNNKILNLPIIDEIKYPLIDYLKNVRPIDANSDFIFVTWEKPYINTKLLKHGYIVKKYLVKAGININNRKTGFHAIRHSFSSSLLVSKTDLKTISEILGHKILNDSIPYVDMDIINLKELALEVPIC